MKIEQATPAQRAAITSERPRIIVIAGPGSGKTATTVARIKRLVDSGVAASEIVAVTFTNNAARELEERLAPKPMGDLSKDLAGILVGAEGVARMERGPYVLGHCGTLHSFCLKLLRDHGEDIGYGSRLSIISPESASDLLASKATTLGCKLPLKDLLALKAKGRPERGVRLAVPETCVATYFDELKEAGIVDFDVLLTEALALLSAVKLDLGFSHLFVDEVQDSSDVDWAIFEALPLANKFFVGDPDQAIYSFRGGNVNQMLAKVTHGAAVDVIALEENFRSRSEICSAANALIRHNSNRHDKRTVSIKGPGGTVSAWGRPPVSVAAANEGEEIGIVSRQIQVSLDGDELNEPQNPVPSIAVLARTNAIAAAYRKTLAACSIPVVAREASYLPKDWPLARALVELLVNPENDVLAFFFLVALYQKKGSNPKDARDAAHAVRKAASSVGHSINRAAIHFPPRAFLGDVTEGLRDHGISFESRMVVADRIKDVGPHGSVLDLALAMASTRENVKEGTNEGVNVLTIHGAKGREFDVVYVVGCEEEVVPGKRRGVDVEEERRLFYVAMTRARETLVLAHCASRVTPWNAIETHTPSRFLGEAVP